MVSKKRSVGEFVIYGAGLWVMMLRTTWMGEMRVRGEWCSNADVIRPSFSRFASLVAYSSTFYSMYRPFEGQAPCPPYPINEFWVCDVFFPPTIQGLGEEQGLSHCLPEFNAR